MSAILLHRSRFIYPYGALREMVLWQVPRTQHHPSGLKYRLYYGSPGGKCLVRYDNERGKNDHRHVGEGLEEPYAFRNVERLVEDFLTDIKRLRGEQ
jgi:hypothetical protein